MLKLFVIFIFCAFMPLAAETIGNVEYQLPNQAKDWIVKNNPPSAENPSTTILYIPNDKSLELEYFGVYTIKEPIDLNSQSFDKDLKFKFPTYKVVLNTLEKTPQSELIEWTVSDIDKDKMHGWARIFSDSESTTMLFYQTEKMEKGRVEKSKEIWLPVLKDAKLKPIEKTEEKAQIKPEKLEEKVDEKIEEPELVPVGN